MMCMLHMQGLRVAAEDSRGRDTAVALNYCRASFHRIRTSPTKDVLVQEEDKILNNLNLNGIVDEAVLKLYAGVLDEISKIGIAEHERASIRKHHLRVFRHQVFQNAFAASGQLLSAQFGNAVRTGVRSWWDYRSMVFNRNADLWKVDKVRLTAINQRTTACLDAFWKLSREKNIPDRWLVRDTDLERLESAVQEPNATVRLRVLKRMEPFMECYPPYWYYVARTQQELGQLFAAAETYDTVANLGTGYFRQDEMLAASLANRAAIQFYLGQPTAERTAREALNYASSVWQANLMCAYVLTRRGKFTEAEDAILRNLDVDLESAHSTIALWELYRRSGNSTAKAKFLSNPERIAQVPIPLLLAGLGDTPLPAAARDYLRSSIRCEPIRRFGRDDLVVTATPAWRLRQSQVGLIVDGHEFSRPKIEGNDGTDEARFVQVVDTGSPFGRERSLGEVSVTLRYSKDVELRVSLRPRMNIAKRPDKLVSQTTDKRRLHGTTNVDQLMPQLIAWNDGSISLNDSSPSVIRPETDLPKSSQPTRMPEPAKISIQPAKPISGFTPQPSPSGVQLLPPELGTPE